jgi:hypothetical protein
VRFRHAPLAVGRLLQEEVDRPGRRVEPDDEIARIEQIITRHNLTAARK